MRSKPILLMLSGGMLAAALVFFNLTPTPGEPPRTTEFPMPATELPAATTLPEQQAHEPAATLPATLELPPSLRGTGIDGRLAVDAEGHLIVDRSVREFFDYLLTGVGEMPLPTLVENMRRLIDSQLQEPARAEAQQLLTQYLDYKKALYDLERQLGTVGEALSGPDGLANLEQRLQAVMALRRQLFAEEETEAFFGREEEMDRFTLERMRIQARSDLSEAEKASQIGRLEAALPENLRQQRAAATAVVRGMEAEQALLGAGGSRAELHALREQQYGAEAAQRLAQLDQEEQRWQHRLEQYRRERSQVQASGMSETDRARELQQLRERLFAPHELRRVEALDRLATES